VKRLIDSFINAFRGIGIVFKTEKNMRIHLIIATLVVLFGLMLAISPAEWIICLLCMGLVFATEMVNTSIENIVDLVSPEHHPLAGKAKDIAAGAVLLSAIFAAVAGLIIFIPKLLNLFTTLYYFLK
jgi:diacylglycerol kinase